MKAYLADNIHMVLVDDDVVVLDTAADAYVCFVGGAAFVRIAGRQVMIEGAAAYAALSDGRFIRAHSGEATRTPPALPRVEARLELQGRPTWREAVWFAGSFIYGAKRFKTAPFSNLIGTKDAAHAALGVTDLDAALRVTGLFARWLPWAPAQGACFYRAFMLRRLLNRAGIHADWVFGVATWPFSAHCWLQIGDLLLDDDVDRVRAYTPIMVA